MKLHYIYHSGFAIETEKVIIIIDYYKDSSEDVSNRGIVHDYLLHQKVPIYVLATHFHPDHYNREILEWKKQHPNIQYIFSSDILKHRKSGKDTANYLHKGDVYNDENIRIVTCGSTDVGSSFIIYVENKILFHAGDLNNWHWCEESTEEEIKKANDDFLAEIKYLKEKASEVDIAMFPVDRRMGKDYTKGAKQFIEQIKTTIFVPMHFGEDYEGGNAFHETAEASGCHFIDITHRGETFDITK